MRITITLEPISELNIPIHYSSLLQGLIYRQLDATLANWLHEEAYQANSRIYKMFTFSRLTPANGSRYQLSGGRIRFSGPASFTLASVNADVLSSLAEHLLKTSEVQLGPCACTVRGIEVLKPPEVNFSQPVRVKALSPITLYSTLSHADGRKKTYYYSPFERDWLEQLRGNLIRKARALGWEDDAAKALQDATFKPLRVSQKDQKILSYKGTVIKGWLGTYKVSLPEAYFWLAYDVGVGAKNAQGFGMVEVVG
jgi:CRISPR-associated endoribonuclease Cas6